MIKKFQNINVLALIGVILVLIFEFLPIWVFRDYSKSGVVWSTSTSVFNALFGANRYYMFEIQFSWLIINALLVLTIIGIIKKQNLLILISGIFVLLFDFFTWVNMNNCHRTQAYSFIAYMLDIIGMILIILGGITSKVSEIIKVKKKKETQSKANDLV